MPGYIAERRCELCPRRCGADRTAVTGRCGGGSLPRVARAALHMWEEPCISGSGGSGAVFFSGCPLGCVYCQNSSISRDNFGVEVTSRRLGEIFLELQKQGAHNINLVSPTQYMPWIAEALEMVKASLGIPVVYNTGGYELPESIRRLEGLVDIYLPDLKYISARSAAVYSAAGDYFQYASAAIGEMFRQTGPCRMGGNGLLRSGTLVRHLVLPGGYRDSMDILRYLQETYRNEVMVSLMSQYTPDYYTGELTELRRPLSSYEYNKVVNLAAELGIPGFMQERSSARREYTPDFNLQGVNRKKDLHSAL